jgi:hypothetical protein
VTNAQVAILVIPISLALIGQIIVLVFGFSGNNRRLDDIIKRLERIENDLKGHEQRITKLEQPLIRR